VIAADVREFSVLDFPPPLFRLDQKWAEASFSCLPDGGLAPSLFSFGKSVFFADYTE